MKIVSYNINYRDTKSSISMIKHIININADIINIQGCPQSVQDLIRIILSKLKHNKYKCVTQKYNIGQDIFYLISAYRKLTYIGHVAYNKNALILILQHQKKIIAIINIHLLFNLTCNLINRMIFLVQKKYKHISILIGGEFNAFPDHDKQLNIIKLYDLTQNLKYLDKYLNTTFIFFQHDLDRCMINIKIQSLIKFIKDSQ